MFRKISPHVLSEFARRQRIEILRGLSAWVAAPEDVIELIRALCCEDVEQGSPEKYSIRYIKINFFAGIGS